MFLNMDGRFKLVFELSMEHEKNPYSVKETQKITLDTNKPFIGLKGALGLYGSEMWWNNIKNGKIKSHIVSGRICRLYEAGQDKEGKINSFTLINDSKELWDEGFYCNDKDDLSLFKMGKMVHILYISDELKSGDYLDSVIEMAIEV